MMILLWTRISIGLIDAAHRWREWWSRTKRKWEQWHWPTGWFIDWYVRNIQYIANIRAAFSYYSVFNESLQRFITENVKILKRCKVSLQTGVTFECGVRNKFSSVEHAIMSATLSPLRLTTETSTFSLTNETYLQNFFLQTNRCSAAER